MIYSSSVLLFAAAIFVIDAEPIRYRRQSGSTISAVPCPVGCSWSFAQAWTKAISFETPTANMIDPQFVDKKNGTFGVMCSLYAGYQQCLRACVASNVTNADYAKALGVSPSYDQVCGQHQSDFDAYLPCVSNNTRTYQRVCQSVNENLLAAGVRLTTQGRFDSIVARQFCRSANEQAYCVFPVLRQTCGDGPYDALRSIVNASLAGIRVSIPSEVISRFYQDCAEYFDTIENGIRTPIMPGNDSSMASAKSIHHRGDNDTTTEAEATERYDISILRDDANETIYGNPTGGRLGPRLRTTTIESSGTGSVIHSSNTFAFFIFSILFSIFLH